MTASSEAVFYGRAFFGKTHVSVAVRLAGGGAIEIATAGKPDCYRVIGYGPFAPLLDCTF